MITYECTRCGTSTELQNTKAQQSVRTRQPCQECGDVTCFSLADELPDEGLDSAAKDLLRAVNDEVLVKRASQGTKHLHIKTGDQPLCGSNGRFRTVAIEIYPKGHYEWCSYCIDVARDEPSNCTAGGVENTTREQVKRAIRHADDETDGYLSSKRYRRGDFEPSLYAIKQLYGDWSSAREAALGWSQ